VAKEMPHGMVNVLMEGDDKQILHMLEKLDVALAPPAVGTWLGMTVDPWIRQRARDRFKKEGDDVSGPWAPLSEATKRYRQEQGYGAAHPINHRTGRLEAYITGAPNRVTIHALGATLTMPGHAPFGELKTKVETAQKGKDEPRTGARPVMGMNERDLLAVLTDLSLYLSVGQFR